MVRLLTTLMISVISGCAMRSAPSGETISVGTPHEGYLIHAAKLPNGGNGYRRLRPRDSTRYGTATLIHAIEHAARAVDDAFPGGYPLVVGDLSGPRGGAHPRHRSHRAGRDADLLYYVRDVGGLPSRGAAWMGFDRYGLAVHAGRAFEFDEARNWHLVKTLVLDERARVKWLFCSDEIKTRLLRHAIRHERSSEAIARATWMLHQPAAGDPHDDHFHVRVGCSRDERALGCREQRPFWPWQADPASKVDPEAHAAATDVRLVGWLFAEQHFDEHSNVTGRRVGVATEPAAVARRHIH